jgi:hypothetical protein
MQGYRPGSAEAAEVAAAKASEAPFIVRHVESCGATILYVYEQDPEWNEVDPAKREQ